MTFFSSPAKLLFIVVAAMGPPLSMAARMLSRRARKRQLGKTLTGGHHRLHQLGDRAHLALLHEAGAVGLDGLDADVEGLCGLAVQPAGNRQVERLALAWGEWSQPLAHRPAQVAPRAFAA